ncbi:MAG: aminoacyl-tRNA hydrolase [Armatimonadetes bacterium]|nr:aminoacyl-tRNA hydrolase [Armatimonadota bacterium]MDE2207563.1 aminoacyl-tRNA hydrolase [Armatimonadota bacterium]
MFLVVGLGNPGREYAGTRHNVGFQVIEQLAARHGIAVARRQFQGAVGVGRIGDARVVLLRPLTFMNLSGTSVAAAVRYHHVELSHIVVVMDDVNLPLGKLRLRSQGSAGGHNGLQNVMERLDTQSVPRIRIGVGGSRSADLVQHVLSRFRKEEQAEMDIACELAADAVEFAIQHGFELAMTRFNPGRGA